MKLLLAFFFVVLITSCSVAPPQPPPTDKALSITSTIAYVQPSPTAASTSTPENTPTITFTVQPTVTLIPTATVTLIPTVTPNTTVIPIWMDRLDDYKSVTRGKSPDGQWDWGVLEIDAFDPKSLTSFYTTRIVSTDGKLVWDIRPTQADLVGHSYSDVSYEPIFWLPNEPYVYLSIGVCCSDGASPGFFTGRNLARLNLLSGEFSKQISEWGFHEFIFSPNGKYLFKATAWNPEIHLIRLYDWSDTIIKLPPKNQRNGGGAWSPDNKRIAFYSCENSDLDKWECGRFSIFIVEAGATPEYRLLVKDVAAETGNEVFFGCQEMEWKDPVKLRLYLRDGCDQNDQWSVDVNTGHVEKMK